MENYKKIVEDVLEMAKKKGVEADCILSNQSVLSLKAEDQQLSEHQVSSSLVLGIRTIQNNKVGTSYSESWDQESLEEMVSNAISYSKYTKEGPLEMISLKRDGFLDGTIDKVYQDDPSCLEEKINFCLELESEVKKKDIHVKSTPYNNLSQNEGQLIYGNSLGTFCGQKGRTFSCYTSALIEKDGEQSMHHHASIGRKFQDLDLKKVVDLSYFHSHKLLGAGPIETGHYDIIFSLDELSEIFGCFSKLFSGKAAMNGTNPWRDKIGESLAVKEFNMIDHPTYDHAHQYTPFDDEGHLTNEVSLIEAGVLKTFYHNSVTAGYFKTQNTFHGSRSPKSTLGVSSTNKIIKTGQASEQSIKKDKHFEVIKMQGLHSGADSVSGNFSFGASGYLKEGDTIITPVAGITISGNFFQMLKEIQLIGDKLHHNTGQDFFSPLMRFGGLKIAGK